MAKPIPKPSEEDSKLGWTVGHDLVKEIEKRAHDAGWPVGMEGVQQVIHELADMGYVEIQPSTKS